MPSTPSSGRMTRSPQAIASLAASGSLKRTGGDLRRRLRARPLPMATCGLGSSTPRRHAPPSACGVTTAAGQPPGSDIPVWPTLGLAAALMTQVPETVLGTPDPGVQKHRATLEAPIVPPLPGCASSRPDGGRLTHLTWQHYSHVTRAHVLQYVDIVLCRQMCQRATLCPASVESRNFIADQGRGPPAREDSRREAVVRGMVVRGRCP
jgi:hypothetical protein